MKVKEFVQLKRDYLHRKSKNIPDEAKVAREIVFSNPPQPKVKANGRYFSPNQRKFFGLVLMGEEPEKAVQASYTGNISIKEILNSPRIQELINASDKVKMAIALEQLPNIIEMLNVFLNAARNPNLRSADKVEAASKYVNYFRDIIPKKEINTQINVFNEYKNMTEEQINEKLRQIIEREKTIDAEYSEIKESEES